MSRNIEITIKVEVKPTDAAAMSLDDDAVEQGEGQFCFVLPEEHSLDIDVLENSMLQSCFPAMRKALSAHLSREGKKNGG